MRQRSYLMPVLWRWDKGTTLQTWYVVDADSPEQALKVLEKELHHMRGDILEFPKVGSVSGIGVLTDRVRTFGHTVIETTSLQR